MAHRMEPKLTSHEMQTYAIEAPLSTHHRVASCAEVDCDAMAFGWETAVDESKRLGREQAAYIRKDATRRHTEARGGDGELTVFIFPPGQQCFAVHHIALDREPIFTKVHGDWRQTFSRPHQMTADQWVNDQGEVLYRLQRIRKDGM